MDIVIDKVKLPQEILEIIEKTNEPMSLDEIVEKFNPPFPFQARRVSYEFSGHIFTIIGIMLPGQETYSNQMGCPDRWCFTFSGKMYTSAECTHCLKLNDTASVWLPGRKAWVLI